MASTTHHFRSIETILFLGTFDNKSSDGVVGVFYCRRGQVNSLYTFSQLIDFRTGNAVWTREANVIAGIPILAASPFNTAFCPQLLFLFFYCGTLFFLFEASYQSTPYQTRTGTITFFQWACSSDKKSLKRCSFCRRLSRSFQKVNLKYRQGIHYIRDINLPIFLIFSHLVFFLAITSLVVLF